MHAPMVSTLACRLVYLAGHVRFHRRLHLLCRVLRRNLHVRDRGLATGVPNG